MPPAPADSPIRFSFRHVDLDHAKFSPARCRQGYLNRFLGRLRDVCSINIGEFRTNRSSSLKCHRIDFSNTTEPNGFSQLKGQLAGAEAWQFEITRNEHGRVHGVLTGDTFYVVWIDPDHLLYSQ